MRASIAVVLLVTREMDPALEKKKREYEAQKARTKELLALKTCTICGELSKLRCPCKTTAYCSVACQKVDWRERGHRKVCKQIRAPAPTPPSSPPKQVFYGPAPRSHADEVRARIAAEHEAARARREANPEQEPTSARFGARCPICYEGWDVNIPPTSLMFCCCRRICKSCYEQLVKNHVLSVARRGQFLSKSVWFGSFATLRTMFQKRCISWQVHTSMANSVSRSPGRRP